MRLGLSAYLPAALDADGTDGVAEPERGSLGSALHPPLSGADTASGASGPLSVAVDGSSAAVMHGVRDRTITMTNLLDAGNDDDRCDPVLSYALSGRTAGDWTLRAREDAAHFTVEP